MEDSDIKPKKTKEETSGIMAAIGVGILLLIVSAIPLSIAVVVWIFIRRFLTLKEYLLTTTIGILALIITEAAPFGDYFHWLKKAIFNQDISHFPLASVLVLSVVMFGFLSLLNTLNGSSRLLSVLPFVSSKTVTAGGLVVPKESSSSKLSPPPESIVVQKQTTTSASSAEPGDRMLALGVDVNEKPIGPTEKQLATHMLVFGTTGSGKTVTLTTLIGSAADLGYDIIVLDLKQDLAPGGLRDFCKIYADTHFKRYQEVHLDISLPPTGYWFNALAGLDKDGAIDAVLSSTDHDDQFHQATFRLVLGAAMELMYLSHQVDPSRFNYPSLYDLGMLLRKGSAAWKDRVAVVLDAYPHRTKEDFSPVIRPTQHESEQAITVGTRLTTVYGTEAAQRILRASPGATPIDITQEGISYIGLNSMKLEDLSQIIASAVLSRVSAHVGMRASRGATKPTLFVIDEANYIDRQRTNNLLSMARSAKFPIVLCTQSPQQFHDERKDWFPVFSTNTNVIFSMIQSNPDSAETMAQFFGTKEVQKTAKSFNKDSRDTERFTVSMREEYVVPVELLRTLPQGQGILRIGAQPYLPPTHVSVIKRSPTS